MRDADLVKFARLTPSEGECLDLLARAESIVTRTMLIAPLPATTEPANDGESEAEMDTVEPAEPKYPGGKP